MAARFWVGGTGNWSDTAHWALTTGAAGGQTVPSSVDDVTFDASSGSGTATIDASSNCKSINMTSTSITLQHGVFSMTIANAGAYGNITLQSAKYTFSAGATWIFAGTSGTSTITTNSNSMPDVTVSGVSGTVSLGGATVMGNLSVTGGTFTASNNTLTCTTLASTGSSTRAVTFGLGAWTINGSGGVAAINFASTGLTVTTTAGSSLATLTGTSGTQTITSAGKTLPAITVNGVGGTVQLSDAFSIGTVDLLTITNGTFDANGQTVSIGGLSSSNSNVRTITMGTGAWTLKGTSNLTLWTTATSTNLTLTITGTPAITVSAASSSNTFDTGGKTMPALTMNAASSTLTLTSGYSTSGIVTITTIAWLTLGANITAASLDINGSISLDAASHTCPDINVNTGASCILRSTLVAGVLTVNGGTFNTNTNIITLTRISSSNSTTRTLTFSSSALTLNGSGGVALIDFTTTTGLTWSVDTFTTITCTGTSGTNTITTGGKIMPSLTVNGAGGTVQLADNWTGASANNVLTVTAGGFDANNKNITIGSVSSSNANVRSISMGSGTWTLNSTGSPNGSFWTTATTTNLTFTLSTSTMITTGASGGDMTITSGGLTMPPLTINNGGSTSYTTLGDNYTITGATAVTITTGSFNLNGKTLNSTVQYTGSGTSNIKCGASTCTALTVNGPGGTLVFGDAFTSNAVLTLTAGTLANNNQVSVTIPNLSSSNTNTRTLTMGNTSTWTLNGSGGIVLWDTTTTTGLTFTPGTSTITTTGTSGINTMNFGGKTINNLTINNTAGVTTQLSSALTLTSGSGVFTLTRGIFDANNNSVTVGQMLSTNSNTRSLLMGGGSWTITTAGFAAMWDTTTTTGLTFTTGGSTLTFSGTSSSNTITTGGLSMPAYTQTGTGTAVLNDAFNSPSFTLTLNAGTFSVNNKTLNVLSITCSASSGVTASLTTGGSTVPAIIISATGTGGLSLNDSCVCSGSITLTSGTFTMTGQTASCTNFASSNTNTRTFTMSTGTLTCTGAGTIWDTTTTTNLTLTVSSGHLISTYTAGTQTIITGGKTMPPVEMNAPGATLQLSDNITISSEDIYVQSGTVDLNGKTVTIRQITNTNTRSTGYLKSSGSTVPAITVNGALGTLQLVDAANCSGALTVTSGTFDAGNQNVTTQTFVSNTGSGRAINMGTGIWSITGTGTVWDTSTSSGMNIIRTPSTIVDLTAVSASSITIATGGATLPTFRAIQAASSGSITVTGAGTFYSFIVKTTTAKTLTMPASTIITIDGAQFFVSGINGALLTYNSSSAATASTIKCGASVAITAGYLSMRDSTTSGAARFVAENSTNTSGNTGWTFNSIDPVKDVRRAASIGRGLM